MVDYTNMSTTSVHIDNCTSLGSLHDVISTQLTLENFVLGRSNKLCDSVFHNQVSLIRNVTFFDFATLGGLFLVVDITSLSFIDCKFLNNGRGI